ncbi:MAG: transporter [Rhizobiaceae bacterium]
MLDTREIQHSLTGAWRVMTGRPDGMRMLDTSLEGFWDSFFAIIVAFPALAIGWFASADTFVQYIEGVSRASIVARLAIVDLAVWLLLLIILGLVAKQVGIADRFVHYVVSGNWASAVLVWMMVPPSLLKLVAPDTADFASMLSLALFLLSMVLTWRQTNVALAKGPGLATAVFVAMFVCALLVLIVTQGLLGLDSPY